LKGGKPAGRLSEPRAALIERLIEHFLPEDLKVLGKFLRERGINLDRGAVDALIDGVAPGEMGNWVRRVQIAELYGELTELPEEWKGKALGEVEDPKARASVTTKPSPGREPRQFVRGNFVHRFAEYLLDAQRLPRPGVAEVRIELEDGTGDIIRADRLINNPERSLLLEIKPAGPSADKGRAQLPGREAALNRYFPRTNPWKGRVVEYTRDDVLGWLRAEVRAARAEGRPIPDVRRLMKALGF
jgi:hypothetical protein